MAKDLWEALMIQVLPKELSETMNDCNHIVIVQLCQGKSLAFTNVFVAGNGIRTSITAIS